jgi:diacylglycerol O-acyltransferase / wax synthase
MMMGMGPLVDMMGLFHGVISCAGKLTINFTSCREMMPDPDFYRQCLQEAYDELEAAAGTPPVPRRRTPAKKRRKAPVNT